MKRTSLIAALLATAAMPVIALAAGTASPTGTDRPAIAGKPSHEEMKAKHKEMREKWKNATPEEREKMKAAHEARFKERYDKASPEEKKRMDEMKARRDEARRKWENATPEEREKLKQEWQAKHKGGKGPHGPFGGPHDGPGGRAAHDAPPSHPAE